MGLIGDFDEVKTLWRKSSFLGKSLAILGFIISTSSIASLAEVIFKWKGFILDGVEFYRTNISQTIIDFFSILDLSYTKRESDVFVIFTILLTALIRNEIIVEYRMNRLQWLKKEGIFYLPYIFILGLYGTELIMPINLGLIFIISVWLFRTGMKYLIYKLSSKNIRHLEYKIKYYRSLVILTGPLLMSIVIVLILAAINKGLNMG